MDDVTDEITAAPNTYSIGKHVLRAVLFAVLAGLLCWYGKELTLPADRSMVKLVRNLSIVLCCLALVIYFTRIIMNNRIRFDRKTRYPRSLWLVQAVEAIAKITAFVYFYAFVRSLFDMDRAFFQSSIFPWMNTLQGPGNTIAVIILVTLVVTVAIRTSFIRPAQPVVKIQPEPEEG